MSRLYDTVEPSVIDDEMLHTAVEEQGPQEKTAKSIATAEGINFNDVTELRLDFKNILKIDNLWCFTNLVKLQLDNNIIERIEGIDLLVNLKWLDLSFNNIEVIEGLAALTKLEDLTLFNNRIRRIEQLDQLAELQIFSMGNNDLKDLENLIYLRNFKKLRVLNLTGNPICELEKYKEFTIAYLPWLVYLDYRLIDDTSREDASAKYEISIAEIEHDERTKQRKQEDEEAKQKQLGEHMAAYVENLDGSQLFDSMYAEDVEGQKLNEMPGVEELLIIYKEKFTAISQEIFEVGLKKQAERKTEVDVFFDCTTEAKDSNKAQGMTAINEFMEYKAKLWTELVDMADQKQVELRIAEFNQKVSELWDKLMGLELELVDQLEETIKDFERNMADMVSAFQEILQGHWDSCRQLENIHNERMLEIMLITLEKVVKNELDEDISDDLRELCVDKDTIANAQNTSHDLHLLKIENRDDDISSRISQWSSGLMATIMEDEISRNRARVLEINNLTDHLREELDNLDLDRQNY